MKVNVDVKIELDLNDIEYISLTSVIDAVSEVFGVSVREIMSPSREQRLTRTRFAIYYLAWLNTRHSFPSVGRYMGRDHTTIMHGRTRAIELIRKDDRLGMHDLRGEKSFKQLVDEAKVRAFEMEVKKRDSIRALKDDMQKKLNAAAEKRVENFTKEGQLSGDKVTFNIRNTEGQQGVDGLSAERG
jgi:hypothetical protein